MSRRETQKKVTARVGAGLDKFKENDSGSTDDRSAKPVPTGREQLIQFNLFNAAKVSLHLIPQRLVVWIGP